MATRTVTLLFCDLVASTELMTRIGDDANDLVRRRFFAAMREAIAAHGGEEFKTVGDEFKVAFTESAADAVACAVAMQRAVARLNEREPLLRLSIRVGLSAGEASHEDGDWFGIPVVETARLDDAARPGQILVADVVRVLVGTRGGHEFTSVGALDLKGLPEPLAAAEVAWEPDPGLPSIPLPSGLDRSGLPFVGREGALDTLGRAWDDASAGELRLVLLSGASGSGKTRLVAEFAARVHSDETIVLYGRSDQDLEVPYQPFTEAVRWYTLSAETTPLRTDVGALGPELTRLVPALRNRLPDLSEPRPAEAEVERQRLFDGVAGLLRAASERGPLLLVLDALHAASEQTFAMLRHLLDAPGAARLLVVGLAEAGASGSAWERLGPALRERPGTSVIELEGLATADIADLLDRVAGSSLGPGGERLAERLREETEGSARYVTELVSRIREAGGLEPDVVEAASDALPLAAVEVLEAACPYMGLRAFEPEDAGLFFGREEAVVGLLSRLATRRLLTVVGASGSGKSSLVRAGLLPAVRRGALPGSADWPTSVLTPGAQPLATLAARLASLGGGGATTLLQELEGDPRALDLAVRQALAGAPAGARLLLVVDQFEELFTLCRDETERSRFIEALLHAVTVPDSQLVLVLAMRADFYGESAGYPGFASALEASQTLLGPMVEGDLRAVIERPAEVAGLRVEPGLTDLMVQDVLGEPGGLPLLSHALLETWKRREGRALTVEGYRAAGGVRGAIAQTADAVFETLTPEQQAAARNLFIRLTELGEGTEDTRRRAALAEVVTRRSSARSPTLAWSPPARRPSRCRTRH